MSVSDKKVIVASDVRDLIQESVNALLGYSEIVSVSLSGYGIPEDEMNSFYETREHLVQLASELSATYNIVGQKDDQSGNIVKSLDTGKFLIRSFAEISNLRKTAIRQGFNGKLLAVEKWMMLTDSAISSDVSQNSFKYNLNRTPHTESGININGGMYLANENQKYEDYFAAYNDINKVTYPDGHKEDITKIVSYFNENSQDSNIKTGNVILAADVKGIVDSLTAINHYIITNLSCRYGNGWGNFTIRYNPNTNKYGSYYTSTPTQKSYTVSSNSNYTMRTFSQVGWKLNSKYEFLGWTTSNTSNTIDAKYNPGKSIYVNTSMTFYPVYKEKAAIVSIINGAFLKKGTLSLNEQHIVNNWLEYPYCTWTYVPPRSGGTPARDDYPNHSFKKNNLIIDVSPYGFKTDDKINLDIVIAFNFANIAQASTGEITINHENSNLYPIQIMNYLGSVNKKSKKYGTYVIYCNNKDYAEGASVTYTKSKVAPWTKNTSYVDLIEPFEVQGYSVATIAKWYYVCVWSGTLPAKVESGNKVKIQLKMSFSDSREYLDTGPEPVMPAAGEFAVYITKISAR